MTCPRCEICEGMPHHWLPFDPGCDPADDLTAPDYTCKHCAAIGDECPECEGIGTTDDLEFDDPEFLGEDCPACDGLGVIQRLPAARRKRGAM